MRARAALLALLLLAGPLAAQQAPEPALPEGAVAVVGSAVIARRDLEQLSARNGQPPARNLQLLVTEEVIRQNLRAAGIDPAQVPDQAVDEALAEVGRELAGQGVTLEQVIARSGRDPAAFRAAVRLQLALRDYLKGQISEARVRALWEERQLALAGELRLREILVAVEGEGGALAARQRADALLARLGPDPGDEEFAALARAESSDPLARLTAGDLDWVLPPGRGPRRPIAPQVVQAAYQHGRVGLVPELVGSRLGIHILRVTAVRPAPAGAFEQHAARLRSEAVLLEGGRLMDRWFERTPPRYAPDAPR